ncbi:hypothetical protein OF117_15290 [Geodermatophilus sp. YIM 151500]|uniref:hypothetical protein n=1 Tax=Geodermatophilus sp. YIM 151500 TaxID=2984531 RepID=UPI0021E36D1E|nr:hypothetical protein [Geodermatophilus sp. YIM 151500]MCV2490723.1 hypothetical protein [Geodermatophilus sp. YIM 151500]
MAERDGERVTLLWTGGWDSTFRLLQLLLVEGRPVQPVYVLNSARSSTPYELRAIGTVRAQVLPRLSDAALLAPTRVVVGSDHPPTPGNAALAESIRRRSDLGTQYLMLSGPAEALGWRGVELAIDDWAGGRDWEHLLFSAPGRLADMPEAALFKYWTFPVHHLSKEEMREIAQRHGFLDVLRQRWSCHDPVLGRPCRRCRPCIDALPDGARVAPSALVAARSAGRRARRAARSARRLVRVGARRRPPGTRTARAGPALDGCAGTSPPATSVGAMGGERVQLLWTGGWDSTFRLLQLLLVERRPVQPIYVLNTERVSLRQELRAMAAIRAAVQPRLADPSLLAPTQVLLAGDYPPSAESVALSESLRSRTQLGTQNLLLAGPAEALGWSGVEMCIPDVAMAADWEALVFDTPGRINDSQEARLFRFWSFPVIDLTKEDMRACAQEHGFLDLLLMRWTCHDPLLGRPCGRCRPCQIAVRDGARPAPPALVLARSGQRRARRGVRSARRAVRAAAAARRT